LLLRWIDSRLDRGLVPAERRLEPGRGDGSPGDAARLIGDCAGEQLVGLERHGRNGGLAVIDPGLAVPIECGRPVRKRSHALELAGVRLQRRKVERRVAGSSTGASSLECSGACARAGSKVSAMGSAQSCNARVGCMVRYRRFDFLYSPTRLPWHLWAENTPRKGRNSCAP